MMFGFTFAFAVALGYRYKLFQDLPAPNLTSKPTNGEVCNLWPEYNKNVVAVTVAFVGVVCHSAFSSHCESKDSCNSVNPYITFVPVINYSH